MLFKPTIVLNSVLDINKELLDNIPIVSQNMVKQSLEDTQTEAGYLYEIQRLLGTTGEVLYLPYPDDLGESQRYGYLGRLSELSAIEYPYPKIRSLPLKIEEIA